METPILFKFVKMDLAQFATFTDDFKEEDAEMEILNRFQFAYNFEDHLVLCKTVIELSKQEKILLKADFDCIFKIDPESASAIETATDATIPQGLLAQFASLSYGSLRGEIHAKAVGTPFCNFILPPNDVTTVFKAPQKFSRTAESVYPQVNP